MKRVDISSHSYTEPPAPAPKPDPVAASPRLYTAFRLFFLLLAVFDLALALFFIVFGESALGALGLGTYAQPRFFQLCVSLFLLQYAHIQYMAFRDPRAHSTCVTLTLFIRLTFPLVYTSAILLWGQPWTLMHTLFLGAAVGDVLSSAFILFAQRRFQIALFQGDAEPERPATDSPWLRRILLVLGCAEFLISLNWIFLPKLWIGLFGVSYTVDPFWTRATGAFLTNIAVVYILGSAHINRYRTAVITSGLFRALWPPLYWYWVATGGEGNFWFKASIMFFSFFDLATCITIFAMLHAATSKAKNPAPALAA